MTYFVHSEKNRKEIQKAIGIKSVDELFQAIPGKIRDPRLGLDEPLSEKELKEKLTGIGKKNRPLSAFSSFLGGGAYNHYIPGAVRSVLGISQFYTAYTPYQAELSQGTLQYIFEFQSLICRLTGMDVANASMYDGASALAEAIFMANRLNGNKKVLMPQTVNPQYRDVCNTYSYGQDIKIEAISYRDGRTDIDQMIKKLDGTVSSVVVQNPNFFGCFEDVYRLKEALKKYPDCIFIAVINPISVGLINKPSDYGADIVLGEGQVFGSTLSFGGPYLGFFAARQQYLRQLPGRIVGQTVDAAGNKAYVLTFQTREQHIRKYKATSNICTNHSLNALASTVYLSVIGEKGLHDIAGVCLQRAHYFSARISSLKRFRLRFSSKFFNEFVLSVDTDLMKVMDTLVKNNILPGIYLGDHYPELKDCILVSVTEMNSVRSIDDYIEMLRSL